jgi:hypothetical protein
MKAFFHPVYVIHHLKACIVIYRTIEVKIVLLQAYSTERTTKKRTHAAKMGKLPHIYMEKTTVKLDLTG